MNTIPAKYLPLVAVLAVILSGCAVTAASASDKTPTHPADDAAARVAALVAEVRDGWTGTDIPDERWIAGTALQVCKRAGENIPELTAHATNQSLLIDAALEHLCPEINA